MTAMTESAPYRRRVRDAFNRAAPMYARRTDFQRALARRLAALAPEYAPGRAPGRILDAGAGSGHVGEALLQRFPRARLVNLDGARAMLGMCLRGESVCADMERLPFAAGAFDLVASGAALHWCADHRAALAEMRRALRDDGLLLLAAIGDGTLGGLARSWRGVDSRAHVMPFPSPAELRAAVTESGLRVETLCRQREVVVHDSAEALFASLKGVGAGYLSRGSRGSRAAQRGRGLTTRAQLEAAMRRYALRHAWRGKVCADYEVLLCCARPD